MRTRGVQVIFGMLNVFSDLSGPGWFARWIGSGSGQWEITLTTPGARWVSLVAVSTSSGAPDTAVNIQPKTGELGSKAGRVMFMSGSGAGGNFGGAFIASYTIPDG